MQIRQNKNKRNSGVSVPLFTGITGVNEHIELVFNAVLSNAVVMLRSPDSIQSTTVNDFSILDVIPTAACYLGFGQEAHWQGEVFDI